MTRVLVLASEVVPLPGLPTNGGGLRGWTLARGLEAAGFEVTLICPRESLEALAGQVDETALAAARPYTFAWNDPAAAVAAHQPAVAVCCSWLLASQFSSCPVPLAVDVAGPVLLEFLYQGAQKALDLAARKPRGLALADFVTCAGERQRAYFYSWLTIAGFDQNALAERVATVPISAAPGLAASPPPGNVEPRIIFAGIALPWQDPSVALRAVIATLDRRCTGCLDVYVNEHPVHSQGATWLAWLREQAGQHARVVMHENRLRPYSEMLDLYRQADLAFDLFARNPERELAFNTRTVDYLACGLPPLYSDYAELAGPIARYDAGTTVNPADERAVAAALNRLLDDPADLAARRAGARRLVDDLLTWDKTIAPLAAWCAAPSRREPGPFTPEILLLDYERLQELHRRLAGAEAELARAKVLAETRKAYAEQVESAWTAQSAQLAALDRDVAAWRAVPWRTALRQTFRRMRNGERGMRH
jgi:hypothetical protein